MPRPRRADERGGIYHVLNRGNSRRTIFRKEGDYEAFERVLAEGLRKYPVDLFAYQWMPNHWHLVVRPLQDGAMSRLLFWVTMTHAQRYHAHYDTVGEGHLYQGRYKSFPVQNDEHFLVVCRYVERNAVAGGLVDRAEKWRWGSLWNWLGGTSRVDLASWPIARSPRWADQVNREVDRRDKERLQKSLRRGCPFGEEHWTESTVHRLSLESTMRPRGRPRKFA